MGARKRNRALQAKEERKDKAYASLNNCPTSPRKMRLVTELIKGTEVKKALDILKFTPREPAKKIEKLLLSAISNWQQKNEGVRIEDSKLYVKEVFVEQGKTLKRLRTAPQGRAHRIRKRSNHVRIILDNMVTNETETNNK